LGTICLGWLWTVILLISASWVARITGINHQRLALMWLVESLRVFCAPPPRFLVYHAKNRH
jgi:hypothetical protein